MARPLHVWRLFLGFGLLFRSLEGALGTATIEPLPLSDVRLLDTALQARYEKLNAKYLLDMLEPDRLLWSFRKTAGLATPGNPYIASWEDPGCELRGHFVGHYLSALSLAWAGTGNSAFKTRLDLMVGELGKVQAALGTGYLSAFPTEFFDRVEALKPVWAPYYTIHKIIAGLVDAHELAGHSAALPMAVRMVDYHWNRTQAVIAAKGREHWNAVLNCEFGGMNEILYRMYRLTKDKTHMEFAQLFNKPFFRKPMETGNDMLRNLHANTHLAQVAGFAEEYDTVGTAAARQATSNFFDIVTQHHSFATGGSTDHEFWQAPDELADSVLTQKHGVETQETCTQYNILKIARSLFRWTGDVRYADFYERALVNGILGTARLPPEDWPEHALPKRGRGGRHHHHHHHHHHVNELRSGLLATAAAGQQSREAASELALAQLQGGGGAAGAGASGAVLVSPHRRPHNEEWLNWWAFAKPQPQWNASDAPGPGVFIYLLPLGTGQSKSDNIHHWGFPFHSFWCCYGTVIESYAKLADSIYFKEMAPANPEAHAHDKAAVRLPPRLYVNQLVSSKATWAEMKLRVTMQADMFTPGPAAVAQLTFESTKAPGPGSHDLGPFTLMLRVPEWLAPDRHGGVAQGGTGGSIEVNGQLWTSCPGPLKAGSYCAIGRNWASGDEVSLRLPMRWRLQSLAENRAQFQGLKAVMLGPFVMAGITHSDRGLTLPAAPPGTAAAAAGAGGGGGSAAPPVELRRRVYPPEESDELVSIQAGWNASLHLRHDSHISYVSQLEDGGDAMDATFRIGRGCHHGGDAPAGVSGAGGSGHHGLLSLLHGRQSAAGAGGVDDAKSLAEEEGASSHGSLAGAFSSLRSMMRLGAADSGSALSLESMSYPNHYLAHDHTDVIVLQPGAAAGTSAAACSRAMWMMRPGLDGAADTVSFEAVGRPGWFVTAAGPEQQTADAAACHDAPGDMCHDHSESGPCARDAYVARVLCRQFCGYCNVTAAALRLRQRPSAGPAAGGSFAAASSFRLTPPARRAYPAGSFVLAGLNRHYLVAPIGHLVDERYTAYFSVETKSRGGADGGGGGGGGGRMGIKRGRRGGEGGGL